MGILDDAIREHLDLKRQHGAPEEEVQRQQDEALGPARREVAQPAEDGETVTANGEPEGAQLDEASPEEVSEPVEAPAPAEPAPFVAEPDEIVAEPEPFQPEPAGEEPPEPRGDTPPRGFEPEPEAEPEERAFEQVVPDDPFGGDEPFADEEAEGDEEGEEGDVLEDTPDFLQETPEHDRLWFEQKPPRDFDFD